MPSSLLYHMRYTASVCLIHRGEKGEPGAPTHLTLQLYINPLFNPLDLYCSLSWVKELCENAPKASM